ncbi:hypothetical protein CRI93_00790 [Longimonas halophila]|uniref:High potential iron-sulfur proteins family profile domain-containing protein n=1 Tax=Longimonas halophila TaxID=1469170 RepID=A0A2H3P461_9BACT|nr:high-potential iron-sulfur protein [Longimonas halophila]PEN09299.1 hypothetical protein CRI93_00790 [Longimonas halophila]
MSDSLKVSRRSFLQRISALGIAGVGASTVLSACGGGSDDASSTGDDSSGSADFSCDDLSGLSDQQISQRETQTQALQYVEESPNPDQNCANCSFWQAPEGNANCGGCQLFPGPVHPDGWCNSWVAAS